MTDTTRRILCVFPRYAPSFGTFQYAYKLRRHTRAFMPPQGMLVIASYLPASWEVRFVDENMRTATTDEFAWADAVLVSGMHVQREHIRDIARRARAAGKVTALGGPSASATPEAYPEFDYLHIGEMGDGTDALIARLAESVARPARQERFQTRARIALSAFPRPAYQLVDLRRYFLGSIQFSSGCPYQCEFCDIPGLYGRVPRYKTAEQVTGELDAMLARGNPGSVYFVDDNFIANRRAARELVPHLVEWQKRNGYPVELACEATLNIAQQPELLAAMREARFTTVFCGIETPEADALHAMKKDQNARVEMLEAVRTLNGYGIEVVAGIILGLDTDTDQTPARLIEFIEASHIPMLTINILQALPKTPLWDRLAAAGRLDFDEGRESNVVFARPYGRVIELWREAIAAAYDPEALFARFAHNAVHTYPNRVEPPAAGRATFDNIAEALHIVARLIAHDGARADYRRSFWRTVGPLLKSGRVEDALHIGLVAHHLIAFSRAALAGRQNASFYSARRRLEAEAVAAE